MQLPTVSAKPKELGNAEALGILGISIESGTQMNAPAVQHLGKENEGPAHRKLTLTRAAAPAACRAAFQEQSVTGNTSTDAGGFASHLKLELPVSAAALAHPQGLEEIQTASEATDDSNDECSGPSNVAAPTMQGGTVGLSVHQHSTGLQQAPAFREHSIVKEGLEIRTAVQKVHPAGMLDAPKMMEAGRCYTEILQLVKPKPDKPNHTGPLWRLPGSAFGPVQCSAGQEKMVKEKTAGCQGEEKKQGGMHTKAQTSTKPSQKPPARTYTEMAERQHALRAHSKKSAPRDGIPGLGAAAVRGPPLLRHDQAVSAVEQANTAAVRALDRSRQAPGARGSKPQPWAGTENRSREAANTGRGPPAVLKRAPRQPSILPRELQAGAKGKENPDCNMRKEGAAARKAQAPFRPGGNAPARSIRPSALADLNTNYTLAHKRMQGALQQESRMAEEKVKAAEWDVARTRNKQQKIERALEEQSLRSSQERRMTRMLLSSEPTLQEMERAGSISAVRSISGQSMSSMHDGVAVRRSGDAATPPKRIAAPPGVPPAKGLHPVLEESPQLAQVYDMSVLRAAQRHPRRRLRTDIPRPVPEQTRSACAESCQASELSKGQSHSRMTVVVRASAETGLLGQSIGHNPFFGEAPKAQAQDRTRMGGSCGKGDARSNPTFEPSESSSLLQPSSQNTVQGPARRGQRSMPCSAAELSSAVSGASLPGRFQMTGIQDAQGSSKGRQERQMTLPAGHQRGRVLPTSASLGRLTVPSNPRVLPEPASEPSVSGPCPDLPSCLQQLAELRQASVCDAQAESPAGTSSVSGGQASAAQAARTKAQSAAAGEPEVESHGVTAGREGAEQEACGSLEQHESAAQRERAGRLPFLSHVQVHGQVLCEQLCDEESPLPAHAEPWGGREDRGVFSSTLSFLEKVRPSERFSPLENSLTTPTTLPAAPLDYPLSDASTEQKSGALTRGGTAPKPKVSLRTSIRAALIKCCQKLPCSSPKGSFAYPAGLTMPAGK